MNAPLPSETLPDLIKRYNQLTAGVINFEMYNQMVHMHHSTAIEGSSLTLLETQTLLEKGLTAGGKALEHHLMVIDHQQELKPKRDQGFGYDGGLTLLL